MSTNFNAGIDSSDVVLSYGEEAQWGVLPAVQFKAIRMTAEGFREQKTRARPEEIEPRGYAQHAITQSVAAEGSLSLAFSSGTYDDMLAGLLNGDWQTPLAITSAANDIVADATLTGGGMGFSTATAGKFSTVIAGQHIKTFGFTNPANNGVFRVVRCTGTEIEVAPGSGLVDETPATGTQAIRGSVLRNGTAVHTFTFQKQLASALFLLYKGAYVSEGSLSAQQGNFMEGSLSFLVKDETKAVTNQSTGAVVPATAGRVIDTVDGVKEIIVNDQPVAAVTQGIEINITKNNARAQYGIGSASAKGMARGTLEISGTMSTYFLDFTMYDLYKAETDQLIVFEAVDNTGAGYVICLPAATLMNPQIVAGGPDSDVLAEFELEGNAGTGVYADVVMQITKIPAAAA
ncbi:MAG TPA: phage tail tube protein [Rhizobacter sp.]